MVWLAILTGSQIALVCMLVNDQRKIRVLFEQLNQLRVTEQALGNPWCGPLIFFPQGERCPHCERTGTHYCPDYTRPSA